MTQEQNAGFAAPTQNPADQSAPGQFGQFSAPAPEAAEAPNPYQGFSIGAVVAIVGAALALIAYPLVWFSAERDSSATINGFGSTSTDAITYEASKAHWIPAIAGVILLVMGVMRLLGKWNDGLNKPAVGIAVLSSLAGAASVFLISKGFQAEIGAYLALVGSLVALAGAVMIRIKK